MKQIEEAKEQFEKRWGIRWTEEHEKGVIELVQKSAPTKQKSTLEKFVNGETYFFRYPFYLQVLSDALASKAERLTRPTFRVLCAGCSSGEEAYSIVFTLLDKANRSRCTLEVVGIDLRTAAIERAQQGIYGKWSLRNMTPTQQNRYLKTLPNSEWQVHQAYREHIKFYVHNLLEPLQEEEFDAVLTCNVLLYLHEGAVRATYYNLNRVAAEKAILITAPTDPAPPLPWRVKSEFSGWPVFTRSTPPEPLIRPAPVHPTHTKAAEKPVRKRLAVPKKEIVAPVKVPVKIVEPAVAPNKADDEELWNAWASGKLVSASEQIRQRIFFEPNHPLWRFLNGVILWEHGWLGKSLKEIERAHELLRGYDPETSIAGLCTAQELQRMIDFWRQQHDR